MIKSLVDILKDVALRHKGVHSFEYQAERLNNASNNNRPFNVYVDSVSLSQLNITTNIFKVTFDIYVIAPKGKHSTETIQTYAYTIATDIMAYIDIKPDYKGIISVYDYSILTLDHYTDDDDAGVKLTLTLETPSPVNLCTLDDNFNDEPYEAPQENDIDIDVKDVGHIDINPIDLPKSNNPCNR